MNSPSRERRIGEEAAEWINELHDPDSTRLEELNAWLMESPRHVEEFLLLAELDTQLAECDRDRTIDTRDLLAQVLRSHRPGKNANVLPIAPSIDRMAQRPPGRARRAFERWPGKAALAAGIGAVLIAAGWYFASSDWVEYSTAVGEIRSLELADGSTVHLNTQSQIKVHFTPEGREIKLLAGEALFTVERDPERPFRVHAGRAVIQALGTQFNVNRRQQATTVSVLEGAVGISTDDGSIAPVTAPTRRPDAAPVAPAPAGAHITARLEAGREASITLAGQITPIVAVDAAKVTAWRHRRLLFKDDTLEDIVAEFNRYNRTPQVRLLDGSIGSKRLSGVVDADAPESFLKFLERHEDLSVERVGDEVTIRGALPRVSDP